MGLLEYPWKLSNKHVFHGQAVGAVTNPLTEGNIAPK